LLISGYVVDTRSGSVFGASVDGLAGLLLLRRRKELVRGTNKEYLVGTRQQKSKRGEYLQYVPTPPR